MAASRNAHLIVVGNEKGGAGKSTLAVHLAIALLKSGFRVGAIDLDTRQRSFSRYFDNRARYSLAQGAELIAPSRIDVASSAARDLNVAEAEEAKALDDALGILGADHDFIVVDSPGRDSFLSRRAHGLADTIITPMNDSFVDFDLLAEVDPVTYAIQRPSIYSAMVWDGRKAKAQAQKRAIDWVVLRNRMSTLDARNKRRVGDALEALAGRIGFRIAPGLSERVVFREMFPSGLTLLDLAEEAGGANLQLSHVAARQELRELVAALKLPGLSGMAQF
jgi:chromosome partitioning protein